MCIRDSSYRVQYRQYILTIRSTNSKTNYKQYKQDITYVNNINNIQLLTSISTQYFPLLPLQSRKDCVQFSPMSPHRSMFYLMFPLFDLWNFLAWLNLSASLSCVILTTCLTDFFLRSLWLFPKDMSKADLGTGHLQPYGNGKRGRK